MLKIVQLENISFVVCETAKNFSHAWQVAAILKDSFGDLAILRGDEMIWNVRDGVTNAA